MLRGTKVGCQRALRDPAFLLQCAPHKLRDQSSVIFEAEPLVTLVQVRYCTSHFREKNMDVMPAEVLQVDTIHIKLY